MSGSRECSRSGQGLVATGGPSLRSLANINCYEYQPPAGRRVSQVCASFLIASSAGRRKVCCCKEFADIAAISRSTYTSGRKSGLLQGRLFAAFGALANRRAREHEPERRHIRNRGEAQRRKPGLTFHQPLIPQKWTSAPGGSPEVAQPGRGMRPLCNVCRRQATSRQPHAAFGKQSRVPEGVKPCAGCHSVGKRTTRHS